jgi:tetratricopeptide (TPR) repeat protein
VYAESYLPLLEFRFSELTALRRGPLKYIEAPEPELYDLAQDAGESRNLAGIHPDADDLAERLREWTIASDSMASKHASGGLDREAEARLRSLGYAAAGTLERMNGEGRGRDPKTMTDYFQRYDRAIGLNASGRASEGIPILRELIPEASENFMARYQLAAALLTSGHLDQAAAELDLVVETAPEFSNGHLLRAEVASQRGRIDEALRSYEAAATTAPELAEPLYAKGQLLESLGRFEMAGEAYRDALRLEPDDREIARRLVELWAGRGTIERAVDILHEIAEASPSSAGVRAALAEALRRRGDPQLAFEAASDALRVDPSSVDALVISGELLLGAARPAEARQRFESASRLDPDRPDVQLGLAAVFFAEDRAIDAEAVLAALLQRYPRYAAAYRVRGEYLERTGDRQAAIRAYRQTLALQPGDRAARAGLARLEGR